MNRVNLFIFIVTHVKQLGGNGRGVVIVRSTPLQQVISEFDQFLQSEQTRQHFQYSKEIDPNFPDMVIYNALEGEEHIVFGKNEEGWKGDYGLTHTDVVVSIH
jgi:hypothetical protein